MLKKICILIVFSYNCNLFAQSNKTTKLKDSVKNIFDSTKTLENVNIISKKPLVEVKADRTIINVEQSINATGSNALELLQKSPGVQVDNNDNISLKGKTGTKIYIDGKLIQLDSKNLAEYLKSLNSADIELIELITSPSAKYDASGSAGVINIKLKKSKKIGFNGNLSSTYAQGIHARFNEAVNINYRNKNINIFGNLSYNSGNNQNDIYLYRIQKDTIYDQHSLNSGQRESYNAKVGLDYFINSKNTIGVLVTSNTNNRDFLNNSNTSIINNANGKFIKTLAANNSQMNNSSNNNYNVNYKYADTNGLEINFDADYLNYMGRGNSYQPNYFNDTNKNLIERVISKTTTPTDINIYSFKLDFEQNLWKGKLSYGLKYSNVSTINALNYFDIIDNLTTINTTYSNSFDYTENVNALYLSYVKKLNPKYDIQIGLRVEESNTLGILKRADGIIQADNRVENNYLDFFPNLSFNWTINKKNTLGISYSRRIDRPDYQDLNPFEFKLDQLTYEKGNPFLKPQYTDNIEITHGFMNKLNTTIGFSNIQNFANQITDTIKNATYIQIQNIATQKIFSLNIGMPTRFNTWWNGYANIWANYISFSGVISGKPVSLAYPTFGAYLQQTFNLGKDYSLEISGWFNGPAYFATTWRTKSQGEVNLGLQKQILNKKGTIKLSVTDIFRTTPWDATSDFGGLYIHGRGNWESQTVRLSFAYNFGNKNIKNARNRSTGLEQESKRVK